MAIINEQKIRDYELDNSILEEYLQKTFDSIDRNLDYFNDDTYQHVSKGNKYTRVPNTDWTNAFFPGMSYLAYQITGDEKYLRNSETYLDSFEQRVLLHGERMSHDLGFLYSLSCVPLYKIKGDERAKAAAIKAADCLINRYNPRGEYIQAWGDMGIGIPDVKIIIDCMMNLCLLYWASEVTGDPKYADVAKKHAITSSKTLMREDGSVYHTYLFDPISGRAIGGKTHQGKYDESTWSRGQAWAVYGFALSYMYTKDPYFLEVAEKASDYFINNLPKNFVHYWDFSATDLRPEMRDSSASSIGACGLLELAKYLSPEKAELYDKTAKAMLQELCKGYFVETETPGYGVITESYYNTVCFNECSSWGDYFFTEAMCRVKKNDLELYW